MAPKSKVEQSGRTWPTTIPAQRGPHRHSVDGRQRSRVLPFVSYGLALAGLWAALLPWLVGVPAQTAGAVSGATIAVGAVLAGRLHEQHRSATSPRRRTVVLAVLWLALGALAAYLTHVPVGAW